LTQSPQVNQIPRDVILWGGTGQAKVVRPIIEYYGSNVIAVFDDTPDLLSPFPDVEIFQGKTGFERWRKSRDLSETGFCVAIGNPHGRARLQIHDFLIGEGLQPTTLAHPTAWIADDAMIGEGSQILAGANIGVETRLGRECIVNTNASVDHECILGDGVGIAPGATLCGLVHVEVNGWVCAGATIAPRKRIGPDAIVGAGAVVVDDVPGGVTVFGSPARSLVDVDPPGER
jgi:sugar O-acyltransferase (sialic acid O-acetyltransferase NeuD family)